MLPPSGVMTDWVSKVSGTKKVESDPASVSNCMVITSPSGGGLPLTINSFCSPFDTHTFGRYPIYIFSYLCMQRSVRDNERRCGSAPRELWRGLLVLKKIKRISRTPSLCLTLNVSRTLLLQFFLWPCDNVIPKQHFTPSKFQRNTTPHGSCCTPGPCTTHS